MRICPVLSGQVPGCGHGPAPAFPHKDVSHIWDGAGNDPTASDLLHIPVVNRGESVGALLRVHPVSLVAMPIYFVSLGVLRAHRPPLLISIANHLRYALEPPGRKNQMTRPLIASPAPGRLSLKLCPVWALAQTRSIFPLRSWSHPPVKLRNWFGISALPPPDGVPLQTKTAGKAYPSSP